MSKLNFRARVLDATKPLSIYNVEDLPELADLNAINRSVPAMPSGMEKEEEAEKHLQDILEKQDKQKEVAPASSAETDKASPGAADLYIPTPEVFVANDFGDIYQKMYKGQYKPPRQYIHVQPFAADQDLPDYDMDEEDQAFLQEVLRDQKKIECSEVTLEDMLDRLEKNSGHSAVSAKEAKLLLKEDDDLILAVYDYWVDKRLRLKQPLIPTVKSEKRDVAPASGSNATGGGCNPYVAFRRRTEKMQTRKNRKNDEASYEKMLKLRRDLARAVTLLEMVKRREKTKKENLCLMRDIYDKRYQAHDFEGRLINEVLLAHRHQSAVGGTHAAAHGGAPQRVLQPAFVRYAENSGGQTGAWVNQFGQLQAQQAQAAGEGGSGSRGQKRPYSKKKRHKSKQQQQQQSFGIRNSNGPEFGTASGLSDDEDRSNMSTSSTSVSAAAAAATAASMLASATPTPPASAVTPEADEDETEGPFAFRRKRHCQYLAPNLDENGFDLQRGWAWEPADVGGTAEAKFRYSLASLSTPKPKCVGMVRRRVGRGGRIILDRAFADYDDLWRSLDFSVISGVGGAGAGRRRNNNAQQPEQQQQPRVPDPFSGIDAAAEPAGSSLNANANPFEDWPHYRPVTPPHCQEDEWNPLRMPRLPELAAGLPTQPIKPTAAQPTTAAAVAAAAGTTTTTRNRTTTLNGLGLRAVSVDSVQSDVTTPTAMTTTMTNSTAAEHGQRSSSLNHLSSNTQHQQHPLTTM